jgi:hypothetical protein
MDFQTYLNNVILAAREKTLANSDQLTLGELILKLEPIVEKYKDKDEQSIPTVVYDFGYMRPSCFDSWRGAYKELALDYNEDSDAMKVTDFLEMCRQTIGKTFTGYKGGEFTMNKHTPIWIANHGDAGSTALIEVVDNTYSVILITGYREY